MKTTLTLVKIRFLVKTVAISPEMAICVIFIILMIFPTRPIEFIGEKIVSSQEFLKWNWTIPLMLLIACLKLSKEILFPSTSKRNQILIQWNDYWKIKSTAIIAIIWCAMAVSSCLIIWLAYRDLSNTTAGGLFASALLISIASAFSVYLASLNIRQILEGLIDD